MVHISLVRRVERKPAAGRQGSRLTGASASWTCKEGRHATNWHGGVAFWRWQAAPQAASWRAPTVLGQLLCYDAVDLQVLLLVLLLHRRRGSNWILWLCQIRSVGHGGSIAGRLLPARWTGDLPSASDPLRPQQPRWRPQGHAQCKCHLRRQQSQLQPLRAHARWSRAISGLGAVAARIEASWPPGAGDGSQHLVPPVPICCIWKFAFNWWQCKQNEGALNRVQVREARAVHAPIVESWAVAVQAEQQAASGLLHPATVDIS